MKIILAGTPEFSVPIFENIIKEQEVVAIITQPDKKAKRGLKLQESPIAKLAKKYNIKIFKPIKINEIYNDLKELDFDIFLTSAFGQYIPTNILSLAKIASINIHGSLLPKYRGAAPIQHAILNGDKETGISLIYMVKKMDAGNILKAAKLIIENDDSDSLFEKMSLLAAKNINKWLNDIANKNFKEIIQDEKLVSFAPKLTKEDALLDLKNFSFEKISNKVKAYSKNPGCFTFLNGKRVKIYKVSLEKKQGLKLYFKDGIMYATSYQFEGKKIVKL